MVDGAMSDKMADEAGARAPGRASRRVEAAEIRAWRVEKVRHWPRRIRVLGVRVLVVCLSAVVLLFVLAQVLPLTTATTKGVSRSSVPHQM